MTTQRTSISLTVLNVLFALFALLLLDSPRNVLAAESDDSALAFVEQHHLGDGLAWLGYQVASRTETFTAIVQKVGRTQAQTLVQDELQHWQPDYQAQWNRNLAAAYAESFTPDELRQLNEENAPPALAAKFRAKQKDVGMSMKTKSGDLLKTFVSKALLGAQNKLNH